MTGTREKVGKPGWRDRLPLIERAVGSVLPDAGPGQDRAAAAVPPLAYTGTPNAALERAPHVAPNIDGKSNLTIVT